MPQKRIRQLISGTRRELPIFTARRFMPPTHEVVGAEVRRPAPVGLAGEDRSRPLPESSLRQLLQPPVTRWEAIGDLPPLAAGRGVVFEWPYSKDQFKDRCTRQHGTCNFAWRDGMVVAEKP